MKIDEIERLMKLLSESDISELKISEGALKISLKKADAIAAKRQPVAGVAAPADMAEGTLPEKLSETKNTVEDASNGICPDEDVIKAPLVGTFYCAPSENAEPFVSEGTPVKKGQILGIIEAMKLMNEIECEQDGIITKILVSNQQMVEYGQPLFHMVKQ